MEVWTSHHLYHRLLSSIPHLSSKSHKGQSGKFCAIGGSALYSGAPFFSCAAALRLGVDLASLITSIDAFGPIKTYSPEVMCRPLFVPSHLLFCDGLSPLCGTSKKSEQEVVEGVVNVFRQDIVDKMNVFAIGMGLGKDESVLNQVACLMGVMKEKHVPFVVDGDALHVVVKQPEVVSGYHKVILTPNAAEFQRLYKKIFPKRPAPPMSIQVDEEWMAKLTRRQDRDGLLVTEREEDRQTGVEVGGQLPLGDVMVKETADLAKELGNITLVRKGPIDIITDGVTALYCGVQGSTKRCGGQGDLLTGAISTMWIWMLSGREKARQIASISRSPHSLAHMSDAQINLMAAWNGAYLVRHAAAAAFKEHGRSMSAMHMVDAMEPLIEQICPIRSSASG